MRRIASPLVLAIALFWTAAWAETPATRPAEPSGSATPATLKELDVAAGSTASDFLRQLQQADPDFQYIAQPGPWEKAPLPRMNLRGVTLKQGVALLQNFVDVQVDGAGAGPHFVYIFRGRNVGSGPPTSLSAFGLADPVERLGLNNAWAGMAKNQDSPTSEQIAAGRKTALKEVLSLLESAASQADSSFQPLLKLHQETEVLLVRGTPAQLNAVSESLRALQSAQSLNNYRQHYTWMEEHYNTKIQTIQNQAIELDDLRRGNKDLFNKLSELDRQNAALKRQLKEMSEKSSGNEKH